MCLAVPGQIVRVDGEGLYRKGRVDFSGVQKEVSLAYVPETEIGDWVIVHVGFAISRLDEDEAAETLAQLRELAALVADQA
jgi:hydrogenase expression/formation protein HypC